MTPSRSKIAALILAVIKCEGRLQKLNLQQALAVTGLGLTGIFAYNLFFFNGLTLIEAGRAALIIALNPVAITLCSALIYREALPASRIVGIPLSEATKELRLVPMDGSFIRTARALGVCLGD